MFEQIHYILLLKMNLLIDDTSGVGLKHNYFKRLTAVDKNKIVDKYLNYCYQTDNDSTNNETLSAFLAAHNIANVLVCEIETFRIRQWIRAKAREEFALWDGIIHPNKFLARIRQEYIKLNKGAVITSVKKSFGFRAEYVPMSRTKTQKLLTTIKPNNN
jgi:hypothetical protein